MKLRSINLSFDGQPILAVSSAPLGDTQHRFILSDDQLHLLARQALRLTFEHYNLVRPEGQS